MNLLLKIIFCLLICFGIFEYLYFQKYQTFSSSKSLITSVYSKPGYKFWTKLDGARYCNYDAEFNQVKFESDLDKYTGTKINVLYFQNTDLLTCSRFIPQIATILHKREIEFAINLENKFEYTKVFTEDFSSSNFEYYREKFKDVLSANDWVDYIVADNAMEFLTYEDRRKIFVILRDLFPKPFIGFRFTKHYDFAPELSHPNRHKNAISEFLPKDDDGDFIITSIKVKDLKRTSIFIENEELDRVDVDGEFINNL